MENILGNNIRTLRNNKGWMQDELASMLKDKFGLTTSRITIVRWESGEQEPQLNALKSLAKLFDVTMDELAGVEPIKPLTQNQKAMMQFIEKADDEQIKKFVDIAKIVNHTK